MDNNSDDDDDDERNELLWTRTESTQFHRLGLPLSNDMKKDDKINQLLLDGNDQVQIKQVACGSHHMLLLDFNGRCWAVGANRCGQLGNSDIESWSTHPCLISCGDTENEFIQSIAAGDSFSAFLSRSGRVFTCGDIPRSYPEEWDDPDCQDCVPRRATTHPDNAIKDDDDSGDKRLHFYRMGNGFRHLFVQDQNTMQLYGMGENQYGVLSTDDSFPDHLSTVNCIDEVTGATRPAAFPCKKIEAGKEFSVLLDYRGALFTSGRANDRNSSTFTLAREPFDRGVKFIDVCCTWRHFIALDTNGNASIFSLTNIQLVPLSVPGPVVQIGSGQVHLYARTSDMLYKVSDTALNNLLNPRNPTQHLECTIWKCGEILGSNDRSFVQLTGSYHMSVIHQACLIESQPVALVANLNRFRKDQIMCDVTVVCACQ